MALVVEDLSGADVIYTITAEGAVVRAADVSHFIKDAFVKQSEKDRERHPPPDPTRLIQSNPTPIPDNPHLSERNDDRARQRGDVSLYHYYLRNMEWPRVMLFFFITVMTGIGGKMPREC